MIKELQEQTISNIKGIGKQRVDDMLQLGIANIWDLLNYYPYRYEDYNIIDLDNAINGDKVTVEGVIYSLPLSKRISNNRNMLSVKVVVDNKIITATWFNRSFLKNNLTIGRPILLTGKWDRSRMQIVVYESEFLDKITVSKKGNLLPVYSLPNSINQNTFRKIMSGTIDKYSLVIKDYLPENVVDKYKLYSLMDAIRAIHFPKNYQDGKQARRRLVYDELLFYQFQVQLYKRSNRQNWQGVSKKIDQEKLDKFIQQLPFKLTKAQSKVLNEILQDLDKEYAMNRLLQGDVGSGKTVVAALALYANYLTGYQGALMVPTEILADQHHALLKSLFTPFGIEVALLTGKLTDATRRSILGQLEMGLIDIVVGTHALIQNDVYFKNLGLVITDEQHRFGVEQRTILRLKGNEITPDVLYMTATPIPRTLAITAFGDMDVSTIDEYPEGRKSIETYWVRSNEFLKVVAFIEKQIKLGNQVYVICPLIEESEKLDYKNAVDVHARLTELMPDFNIGLMHGRLSSKEKEEIMSAFTANNINVLVSTTVVEVGVDVPNANLMVIYDAERFGLAQLHQLRGRVGRGKQQSYCVLLADPKSEASKERMRIMTRTNDGFEIARRDLELRGPGDFFGVKQSGVPDFKLADIIEDYRVLEVARKDAEELIANAELWNNPKWNMLLRELEYRDIFTNRILDS